MPNYVSDADEEFTYQSRVYGSHKAAKTNIVNRQRRYIGYDARPEADWRVGYLKGLEAEPILRRTVTRGEWE